MVGIGIKKAFACGLVPAVCVAALAIPGAAARPTVATGSSALDPVRGHFPVLFLLCDFKSWRYEPNSLSYYRKLWIKQHPLGTFSSLDDYFRTESYGKMDLAGSLVRGWFHMNITPLNWYSSASAGKINGNRISVRWLGCVNAAEGHGLGPLIFAFRAVVVVTPYVQGIITGTGLPIEPALKAGQKTHAPVTMTVDSTKGWPPAPFLMTLPTPGFPFGENVEVTKVTGRTLTIVRGYNEGVGQVRQQLPALAPGGTVVVDTDDDFGGGPGTFYFQLFGQRCPGHPSAPCPSVSLSKVSHSPFSRFPASNIPFNIGYANQFAGDNKHDGNANAGVGSGAHEVGHATGYNHSRALSSSATDYNDCYDQMSYSCGLPGIKGVFGPPDGVFGLDAIDREFHGWIPARLEYNHANRAISQVTIKLHALGDPRALTRSHGAYLDAHLPARVRIEDVVPSGASGTPTFPPTCTRSGYHCATSKYYTVEYRQLFGFDSSLRLLDNQAFGGLPPVGMVVLHLFAPDPANGGGNISYLVDRNPDTWNWLPDQAGLQPGDDYADPSHATYVAVNAFDRKALTATVTLSTRLISARFKFPGPRSGQQGSTATLEARLTVGGAPVPRQPVSLKIGPSLGCGPVFTDSTGLASCRVTLSVVAGTWPMQAYFSGDQAYLPLAQYSTFTVSPSG